MRRQITYKDIEYTYKKISPYILKTPTKKLAWMERLLNFKNVIAKFENHQITNSFKYRGAVTNSLRILSQERIKRLIVASAGGHGLAMAKVAEQFNIPTTIVIPNTAAEIKKEKIANYKNVTLLVEGKSLEDSIYYAKKLAQMTPQSEFISPYNHPSIIKGQGTIAIEERQLIRKSDLLVVPIGGGGLISGIAIAAKKINPQIQIIGVQAKQYASLYKSLIAGKATRVPNMPTYADGLAVNLEENSITLPIVQKNVNDIILVTEEEIAASVSAILAHESELVEGAGAVSIAALLSGKLDKYKNKNILLIVSGGNITRKALLNLLTYPFSSRKLLSITNLIGVSPKKEILKESYNFSETTNANNVEDIQQFYTQLVNSLNNRIEENQKRRSDYQQYCQSQNIIPDQIGIEIANKTEKIIKNFLQENKKAKLQKQLNMSKEIFNMFLYRNLIQLTNLLGNNLEWRSASYNQATIGNFFDIAFQDNPNVNYNRYESFQVSSLERHLAQMFKINLSTRGFLITSSGMSAYTILESFLIRNILKPQDKILIPYYIYFEVAEQINSLKNIFNIKNINTYNIEDIISTVKNFQPKVLFLDPLTNREELNVIDLPNLLHKLDKLQKTIYVVIDGTMMAGMYRPDNETYTNLKILYHESGSKYLQLGLDLSMAGLLTYPREYDNIMRRIRRNTGTILYDYQANLFPKINRTNYILRLKKIEENAIAFMAEFNKDQTIHSFIKANYPKYPTHPDYKIAQKYDFVGGIITFTFLNKRFKNREMQNSLIEIILANAHKAQLALTKGLSFGFSIPRISAAASMAENEPPFLRLFIGDLSSKESKKLAKIFKESIKEFRKKF